MKEQKFSSLDYAVVLISAHRQATGCQEVFATVETLISWRRKKHSAFAREEISRTLLDSVDVEAELHEFAEVRLLRKDE